MIHFTETYCAILAVSPAACRHPQMPACFRVCCREPLPNDKPSHFSTAPELRKAQSTALLQYECAALKIKHRQELNDHKNVRKIMKSSTYTFLLYNCR